MNGDNRVESARPGCAKMSEFCESPRRCGLKSKAPLNNVLPLVGSRRARYPDARAIGGFVHRPERETGMGKKIDIAALKPVVGTLYPPPFDEPCRLRERTRLGDAV